MKFRFGIQFTEIRSRDEWVLGAKKAESLGYSTLFVPDHLELPLAPLPALMAAADATTSIRVGTLVLCNDWRHPVMLAKEAATVDMLSGGRLELGLGAGWMATEYEAAGLPFDAAATRVERLGESLPMLRELLDHGRVDLTGRHYRANGSFGSPRPAQARVPLLVGGGSRQVLRLAGRHADIVGIHHDLRSGKAMAHDTTPGMTERKLHWVREGAGRRFSGLELQVGVGIFWVTPRAHTVRDGLSRVLGVPPDEVATLPNVLVGTVPEIVDQLQERRERFGLSYVVLQERDLDTAAPVVGALSGT